ncbi:MAG: type I-U CRISPR-associated helicase/endonuclease Cas3 [Sandaracinaceae bacterium]|nr:type I-U CRISPR-associated helicase/endonuclease Cas3 [Sandaracinaceae bacterium]
MTHDPLSFEEFDVVYCALTGHDGACRWQHRLQADLEAGRFPTDVELATGLGKTSVIALWILALARSLERSPGRVPRRLAYVVDRRVVVDQASDFAERIRTRLDAAALDASDVLHSFASRLREAGCTPTVIETSTLRGQRALDTRWRDDPSRPAIVVGTVDMIGSRLLFSAYGRVGPWGRSLEAGLLGQDCLLVLDEAHLSSPFAATLAAVPRHRGDFAPFAVIRTGATMAPVRDLLRRTPGLRVTADSRERSVFQLLAADTEIHGRTWPREVDEPKVSDRLNAPKAIEIERLDEDKGAGAQLADWAIAVAEKSAGAVIGLVLNTVVEARRAAEALAKHGIAHDRIVVLTGSMRGWDRDRVVESEVYRGFASQRARSAEPAEPSFLVATSCVEVGADIDCDHLGTEACAADSLIQRLGRVNRLGVHRRGVSVKVIGVPGEDGPDAQVFARLETLANGGTIDGAPATFPTRLLSGGEEDRALLGVRVPPPALTRAVLDDLAMTSKHPDAGARPDVGRWLHGSIEEAALYIELAWRAELDWIADPDGAQRLVNAFPIAGRETARCPLHEAVSVLAAVHTRAMGDPTLAQRPVLMTRFGVTTSMTVGALPEDEAELRGLIRNSMVVLPTCAGGYDGRFVDPAAREPVVDVAEESQPSSRARRRRVWITSGRASLTVADDSPGADPRLLIDPEATDAELMGEVAVAAKMLLGPGWRLIESAGNARVGVIVAREDRRAIEEAEDDGASLGFRIAVPLDRHLGDARSKAEGLCERLQLPSDLAMAIVEAAGQHDLGKDRPWWQRAVGQVERPPVAKSGQSRFDHKINRGYRHELGSVADLEGTAALGALDTSLAELCLHLVAAHHGHARPGFRVEAIGPLRTDAMKRAFAAAPGRFARMQAAHGWWGLAYLEALVKAADVLASRDEEAEAAS